jgi:hypothetical protein
MKFIRLLLVVNLLYCLEIIVEVILRRTDLFMPEPVALGIFIAKEIIFMTLLYSLTIILREHGEKQSVAVAVYCYMAAVTIHSTAGAFSQPEFSGKGIGLMLLTLVSEIYLVYQFWRVRHARIKPSFRLVGGAFVLAPLMRLASPVFVIYLNDPDAGYYYVNLTMLLPPFAILLLHANYLYQAKRSERAGVLPD